MYCGHGARVVAARAQQQKSTATASLRLRRRAGADARREYRRGESLAARTQRRSEPEPETRARTRAVGATAPVHVHVHAGAAVPVRCAGRCCADHSCSIRGLRRAGVSGGRRAALLHGLLRGLRVDAFDSGHLARLLMLVARVLVRAVDVPEVQARPT